MNIPVYVNSDGVVTRCSGYSLPFVRSTTTSDQLIANVTIEPASIFGLIHAFLYVGTGLYSVSALVTSMSTSFISSDGVNVVNINNSTTGFSYCRGIVTDSTNYYIRLKVATTSSSAIGIQTFTTGTISISLASA